MPFKIWTGKKPSVSQSNVLFLPYVVQNLNVHFRTKALNMHHQAKKVFTVSSLELHRIKK